MIVSIAGCDELQPRTNQNVLGRLVRKPPDRS
jgi:hypothetical protein